MLNNPGSTEILKIASCERTFALISIPRRVSTSLFPRPLKLPPPNNMDERIANFAGIA